MSRLSFAPLETLRNNFVLMLVYYRDIQIDREQRKAIVQLTQREEEKEDLILIIKFCLKEKQM